MTALWIFPASKWRCLKKVYGEKLCLLFKLNIEQLYPEQQKSIRAFMEKGDVFVNLPTGYGKSLIFQCLPIVADVLNSKSRGSSLMVVISPLKSLMKDQVNFLGTIGIPAIAIEGDDDPEIIQQIKNGYYIIVYCSPECMLSIEIWRALFDDATFREMLIGVAIDENHCITQWLV